MSETFLWRLQRLLHGRGNSTEECVHEIDHYMFYRFSIIPAVVISILLAATSTRRKLLSNFMGGRPGLIFPMDTMTRSARFSYSCAFGAMAFLVYLILKEHKFAFEYNGPVALKTLIAVLSMFIYGMVYFPVFASLALATAFSYLIGSLYTWMFLVVDVYKLTECSFNVTGRVVLLVHALPRLLCLAYLSVSLPFRFIRACKKQNFILPTLGEAPYCETLETIKDSYQGKHVRRLLRKPDVENEAKGMVANLKLTLSNLADQFIYHRQSGFRFPSRLLSVMFASASVIYVVTVELLALLLHLYQQIKTVVAVTLYTSTFVPTNFMPTTFTDKHYLATLIVGVVKWSMIVSVSMACVTSFINILFMLSSFRTNLYALYRGDSSQIPPPSAQNAASLCVGSIKYAGFQVAYIFWAYIISMCLYLVICFFLSAIILSLLHGYSDWLLHVVSQIWPSVLSALAIMVLQMVLAKCIFLQGDGRHLRLDNRILKAMVIGVMFLARLDCSTLPRRFEFFDPGFAAYQGYIHLEVAHTHPVVNVFIRLLAALSRSRSLSHTDLNTEDLKIPIYSHHKVLPTNVSARFHWHVLYTLLHNPTIRIYRKGFIQAMKKARLEGLKVPISDQPITEFDLVKLQAQKERLKEYETLKSKSAQYNLLKGATDLTVGISGVQQKVEVKVQGKKKEKHRKRRFLLFRRHKKQHAESSLIHSLSVDERDNEGKSLQEENIETVKPEGDLGTQIQKLETIVRLNDDTSATNI
ncbi:stimulated by retinoic acid gene 6 protein [Biomphalaria glabrata]|nr:stimulated by retinoic acid gene 6 protein [Biomphalaria glabrata]